ncbi:PREDICTED: uncharacterized protein LOC106320464 [Brassica oleracea var. oleracea]|uniref:uncharacterized protein LOC106320464 n=1 Tax=Brassica oleracea var. oleracea TaxID=109376 RepID=UPI0006A74DA0|nr:PREDICTED: uncharacterized protein LOC106320464 [Brassica oleracea var. oleracea]
MPRAKKETQAEITQRTMEEMQTQLAQLSQAMQGLLAQRNAATPVEEQDDEQSDHDDDANPFAVLGANQQIAQPAQLNERWDRSFKFKIQSSMAARIDIHDSDRQPVARFIGGLRQQIQYTLNLFNPLTLSEAHQHALTVEAQSKTGATPWNLTRQWRTTPTPSTTTPPTLATPTETTIVPVDTATRPARTGNLCCFACGELGHCQANCPTRNKRSLLLDSSGSDVELEDDDDVLDDDHEELIADTGVSLMLRRSCLAPRVNGDFPQRNNLCRSRCTIEGKVCKLIIASGSSENIIAADAVKKLSLKDELHPTPYKLAWL